MCKDCKTVISASMLVSSNCEACGRIFISPGAAAFRYCRECADRIGLCELCGKSMYEQLTFFEE